MTKIPDRTAGAVLIHEPFPSTTLKAAYTGLDHQQIAAAVNVRDIAGKKNVSYAWITKKAGAGDHMANLQTAADGNANASVRSAARALLVLLQSGTDIDTEDADIISIFTALQTGGVFSPAVITAIHDQADTTISLAEQAGWVDIGDNVLAADVAEAIGWRQDGRG